MRYNGPVCRFCRREGEKLYLKGARCESPKCPITRGQAFPPGVHGPKGKKAKKSEYGKQLKEKQKAKVIFGMVEKQFKNYYEASTKAAVTGDALMQRLEKRLDNVIYRAGLASSRAHARQVVGHGSWKVNGKVVDIPSYQMKVGDTFEMNDKMKKNVMMEEVKKMKIQVPAWLKVDQKNLSGEVLREPGKENFEKNLSTSMIIEFYSK
ncbi:MAG: 30S ribosomal protein S4 [Patescibacteria group bacterium]